MKILRLLVVSILFVACSEGPEILIRDVSTWKSIEKSLQNKLITTKDSVLINIPAGNYTFTRSLLIDGKRNVTLIGAGMDKTILSFAAQEEGAEGIKISNCVNFALKNMTVEDARGDNIKVTDTRGVTFQNVKSQWTGEPKEENGAYAFYPVLSKNVLIENCVAIGSSDAGIYVGQSDSVIIRNNEAYYNVAGIESENSNWVDIHGNNAHHNTGGILVFDLPGLTQYGSSTRVFDNLVVENNYRNFAPAGNIVATVPPGTGLMLLATRKIDVFENEILNNKTAGLAIVSYDLVEALATPNESQLNENIEIAQKDINYDPYPNEVYIHENRFENDYLFPTFKNDFGLLFTMKFPFSTPDIIWDGISDPEGFQLCISEEKAKAANLDAANDFEALTTDMSNFHCKEGKVEQNIVL